MSRRKTRNYWWTKIKIKNNSLNDKEIPKERYISLKERKKLFDNLRQINGIIIEYQKIIKLLENIPN